MDKLKKNAPWFAQLCCCREATQLPVAMHSHGPPGRRPGRQHTAKCNWPGSRAFKFTPNYESVV